MKISPLALNRKQRRGVPIFTHRLMEQIDVTDSPDDLAELLRLAQGYAASWRDSCATRGWTEIASQWADAIIAADAIIVAGQGWKEIASYLERAERATYQAANAAGESGGRARSRRRGQRSRDQADYVNCNTSA